MLQIKGKLNKLKVNGENLDVVVKPQISIILCVITRTHSAKPGCENGDCGSCTVLIDDWPIKSCLMLTVEAIDKKITTIEGLRNSPFRKLRRKFCISMWLLYIRFLMVCHSLAKHKPR